MKVTGIVTIRVDGKTLRSKKGASINFGGKKRTGIVAGEFLLYGEENAFAEVDCTVAHTADTDVLQMADFTDATLIFETDTGKQYIVKNAFTSEPPVLTGGEGDLTLKMMGDPATEG